MAFMRVLSVDEADGREGSKAEKHLADDGALVHLAEGTAVLGAIAVVSKQEDHSFLYGPLRHRCDMKLVRFA